MNSTTNKKLNIDEIKNEAKETFLENGGEKLNYVECFNDNIESIKFFKNIIHKNLLGWMDFK